jgi:DNA-binding transcriptional ArsR family regulator
MKDAMPAESEKEQDRPSLCGAISDMTCYDTKYPNRKDALDNFRSLKRKIDLGTFTSGIRLGILLILLRLESACVCEIQYALEESRQSLISHHLRELRKKGWLKSEKWKRWTFYSIPDDKRNSLSALLTACAF